MEKLKFRQCTTQNAKNAEIQSNLCLHGKKNTRQTWTRCYSIRKK